MIAFPRTSTGRIFLAIALSALLHAFLLFWPNVLPSDMEWKPSLIARLEPLSQVTATPARQIKAATPKPRIFSSAPSPDSKFIHSDSPDVSSPTSHGSQLFDLEKSLHNHPPLPRHVQLTFIAYKGTLLPAGQVHYQLDISDDMKYTISSGMNTTGIVALFKRFDLEQLSSGTLTDQGFRPDLYNEYKNNAGKSDAIMAEFNWQEQSLTFSDSEETRLFDQTQDILSFLFQLSQLPLDDVVLPMYITNGKKLKGYELAVGVEEEVETRLGKLRALPIKKLGAPDEAGLTIWLGLNYRLLPIKIQQIDRSGKIHGEMLIADIQLAD